MSVQHSNQVPTLFGVPLKLISLVTVCICIFVTPLPVVLLTNTSLIA